MPVVEKIIKKITFAIAQVSMWAILAITFVLVADIILRFSTESSALLGTYEMTELAMIIIIYLGLAVTQVEKDHIRIRMLIDRFPWRVKGVIESVVFAFTAYLCFMLFYAALLQSQTVIKTGLTTQVLFIPHWPFLIIMTVGLGVLGIVFVLDTIQSVIRVILNQKPEGEFEKSEADKVLEETKEALGS